MYATFLTWVGIYIFFLIQFICFHLNLMGCSPIIWASCRTCIEEFWLDIWKAMGETHVRSKGVLFSVPLNHNFILFSIISNSSFFAFLHSHQIQLFPFVSTHSWRFWMQYVCRLVVFKNIRLETISGNFGFLGFKSFLLFQRLLLLALGD